MFDIGELAGRQDGSGRRYLEFLRVPAMSAGVYALAAGSGDPQTPHGEDELYHVLSGRAVLSAGEREYAVAAGSVCFVPAGMPHRFHTITEDLRVLVLFAPCEEEPAAPAGPDTVRP
ncbi:cupin domain-containing protein [Streptomyces sp. NPDC018045]|uniref:cupin domain-containing protein n=1 Tax=Streptomyces sp. NPDC018045 TaxID=3365037 RepID=UPI0037B9FBD7